MTDVKDMALSIDTGTTVTLHFSLVLENGHVVDSNFDTAPATFTVGDGNLLAGFENSLMGLVDGDEREFLIQPENAFGQHNPQNVQAVERNNFENEELELGTMFSFQNGDGELPGVVVEVQDNEVMVDFNHPLAGQSILFKVKIISVIPQSVH
jgi:FKBP-type peptidyl-prolyl cis-trans isomerase SlpA